MTERVEVDWEVDREEVILHVRVRMSGAWFIERARQIYQVLQPASPVPHARLDADRKK